MNKLSLQAKAREVAQLAAISTSGRAADTIYGGHERKLRQTVMALQAGTQMAEHVSPGEGSLIVISGRLWLVTEDARWSGREWCYLRIPDVPHSVEAETDTVFLLTVSKRG